MKSNHLRYNFEKSRNRIKEILKAKDTSFEELKSIPSRDKLTYNNGFYVYCTALFVDIRGSSKLPEKYRRPTLAKLYRSYLSELVAVINGDENCSEINIVGDSVWGIFNTPKKSDINSVFSTTAKVASIIDYLNYRLKKVNIAEIKIGIGVDYGRALMIKAGYNGSGINDVVWMGDVVNQASKLCGYGNKTWYDKEIMVSDTFYSNLSEKNQKLFSWSKQRNCWNGNVINIGMNNWINENCK